MAVRASLESDSRLKQVPLRSEQGTGRLFFFSSLLNTVPQSVSDATGFSAHLRLKGRTVAWAGTPPSPSVFAWPWLGVIEPAKDLLFSGAAAESGLSIRLAVEDYTGTLTGWVDLIFVLLLPALYFSIPRRSGGNGRPEFSSWWLLLLIAAYVSGLFLVSDGGLFKRPVPFAGHSLECLLHLMGLSGVAVILRELVGAGRVRRLSFSVLASYLIVGVLPLAVGILIAKAKSESTDALLMMTEVRAAFRVACLQKC